MQDNTELNSILLKCMLLPDFFITIQNLTRYEKECLSSYYRNCYPAYYSALINQLECLADHDVVLNAECMELVMRASELYDIPYVAMVIIQRIAEWQVYDSMHDTHIIV